MISSGTKRGLAVAAISALAVTGVPGIANAVTLSTQQGAGVTIRSVVAGETASVANDGKNTTISLVATAANTIPGPVNVEFVTFFYDNTADPAGPQKIGTANKSATGEFALEWTPPVGLADADISAVVTDAAGTPLAGPVADTELGVAISGTAPTVEINPSAADLGYFMQPDGGVYPVAGENVAGISGTTSLPGGNPAVEADSLGVTGGSITAGTANAQGIRQWVGTVNVDDAALDNDANVADQILPVVSVTSGADTTRDAQGFNLYKQTIGGINAVASPADPDTGLADVTVTVVDTQGKPVAGAHVVSENPADDGFTNGLGQITFTAVPAGAHSYYVDTTNVANFNTGVDFRTSTTVTAARPETITFTSADGAAFDWDEWETNDLKVKVVDAAGNPLANQRVFYKWTYAAFSQDGNGEGGSTAEINGGTTSADGTLVIPRPSSTDFPTNTADTLVNGGKGGALTLNAYVNRDGSNPGQDPIDLALAPQTIKVGESVAAWDAADETDVQVGTTQTITGSLKLADGTALAGRTLDVTYAPAGNSVLATTQPAGTTRLSNTSATVVTGADGTYGVSITDPVTTPQAEELNNHLIVRGTATVGSGATLHNGVGVDATDDARVDFIADAAPFSVEDAGAFALFADGITPGRPATGMIRIVNASGNPLAGQKVTLKTDHGFFTPLATTSGDLVPTAAPTAGALYGVWKNLGDTITVTTDTNGEAQYTIAIEKDAGFDDDGEVTANIVATVGGIASTDPNSEDLSVDFDSIDPLNNGGLDVKQAAQQTVGVLPKAPTTETVFYDVHAKDQFGNLVENDPVEVSTDHGFIAPGPAASAVVPSSVIADKTGSFAVGATTAGDATPEGDWTTEATTWADGDPLTPGLQPTVRTINVSVDDEGETVNFYEIDFAASSYELEHDTANSVKVGTTVIETYTAIDQNGEPMSGVGVDFFRNGPDTQQDGEVNWPATTNADGKATYVFSGTKAGTATLEALITDSNGGAPGGSAVPSSRATDQVVFSGDAIPAQSIGLKVVGSSKGKQDIVKAKAKPIADGAVAVLYKNGKRVKAHKLNDAGDWTFKVRDTNGKKKTKYTIKVKGSTTTKAAQASVRIK